MYYMSQSPSKLFIFENDDPETRQNNQETDNENNVEHQIKELNLMSTIISVRPRKDNECIERDQVQEPNEKNTIDNLQQKHSVQEQCEEENGSEKSNNSSSSSYRQTKPTKTMESREDDELYGYEKRNMEAEIQCEKSSFRLHLEKSQKREFVVEYEEEDEDSYEEESEQEFKEGSDGDSNKYEPTEKEKHVRFLELTFNQNSLDEIIRMPIKKGFKLICLISIQTSFLGLGQKCHLALSTNPQVLLSAKKQLVSFTPSYIICKNQTNHSRRNPGFVGKLTANFSGTQWTLVGVKKDQQFEETLIFAQYDETVLGYRSIRSMNAYKINPEAKAKSKLTLMDALQRKKKPNIIKISTASPSLIKGRYQLDFQGHAKVASIQYSVQYSEQARIVAMLVVGEAERIKIFTVNSVSAFNNRRFRSLLKQPGSQNTGELRLIGKTVTNHLSYFIYYSLIHAY